MCFERQWRTTPDRLRVYCEEPTHAAKTTDAAVSEIDGLRTKLGSRMDHLAGTWTGQAGTAHLDLWAEINEECGDMLADLRWIGEPLGTTEAAFTQNQRTSAAALN